jgi:hypothetical protein
MRQIFLRRQCIDKKFNAMILTRLKATHKLQERNSRQNAHEQTWTA